MRRQSGMLAARQMDSVLGGSWRRCHPPLELGAAELADLAPLLLGTGAAPLGWWRARHSNLHECPAALDLRSAYRMQALATARQELAVAEVFRRLRARRVEPLLVKGWAAARLYPEPGLRAWGDVDVVIRPQEFARAQVAIAGEATACPIELHRGFDQGLAHLDGASLEEVFERSQTVPLDGAEVRIPSPEDHLRILCVHMLGH